MDESFNLVIKKLIVNEGGYTDGKNQVKDMPTNMGIQQSTLDFYNKLKPGKNFPKDVKNLQLNQAIEIYKDLYWDNTKIPEIRNTRLKFAIFDKWQAVFSVELQYCRFVAYMWQQGLRAKNAGVVNSC